MPRTHAVMPEQQPFIISTFAPSAAQKWLAVAVVCGISIVFVLIVFGPFRGVHLHRVDAFVPAYVMTMVVCDSITALLLYTQFAIVRARASLAVASAYLFAALVMIPFILVFPGVFVRGSGLMGGMQSTSWVYFFQHAGFPLFIIGYAFLNKRQPGKQFQQGAVAMEIALSIVFTVALVLAGAFVFIEGEALLPRVTV